MHRRLILVFQGQIIVSTHTHTFVFNDSPELGRDISDVVCAGDDISMHVVD